MLSSMSAALESEQPDILAGLDLRKQWEDHQVDAVKGNTDIPETDREAIVRARRGQGVFRQKLMKLEHACRVTHIGNPEYLIASHIKPWRHSDDEARLDGENGLMLCPNVDLLFDRGLISFEDDGEVILSPVADELVLPKMGIDIKQRMNVGGFTSGQKHYLDFHRSDILLKVG
jgi:putative restriction endonuclease